jgi:RimJ/RimL family protein N-acetyltransferase
VTHMTMLHPFREAPPIETERLRLRGHRLDDVPACAAMWSDPNVTRHIGGTPSTPQQSWARILGYVGHWALMGYGYWAIEEKATGTFAGELGFADFRREVASTAGVPEIGWALASAMHGKGYATEAVRAVVGWGDANFAAARTLCLIAPDHAASIRVAQKCGYREFERTVYNGRPTVLFDRYR